MYIKARSRGCVSADGKVGGKLRAIKKPKIPRVKYTNVLLVYENQQFDILDETDIFSENKS